MHDVPTIDTERLALRGHRLVDFDDCAALWADPMVTRYIGGKPFSREEVWGRFLRNIGHWTALEFGYWVVHERGSGHFVGEVGFADFKRHVEPSLDGAPEIGWVITPSAHGRGFATEAVRAIVAWGDVRFGPVRTACLIDTENLASIHVAEKCGYSLATRGTYRGAPTLIYERQINASE